MGSFNNCQTERQVRIAFIVLTLCLYLQFKTVSSTKSPQGLRPTPQMADQKLLPLGWEKFCVPIRKRTQQVDVQCFVNQHFSGHWNFDDLKLYLAEQNLKYTFSVVCEDAASISLYWPMKAPNLRGISVENCRLKDYFSGLEKQSNIPDELEYYIFRNNIIVVDIKNLVLMAKAPIDEDYDCGNEDTIQHYVNRNTTYEFANSAKYNKFIQSYYTRESTVPEKQNDIELIFAGLKLPHAERKQLTDVSKDFHAKISSAEHKCMFKSLNYKEDSPSDHGFSPTVQNSNFPVLSIYNMSHSNLQSVPESMTKWFYHFQNLQLIDASYNNIKKFRFDSDVDVWNNVPTLTVNLSYNNITEIKAKQIEALAKTKKLFVDFRNNPINCSCTDLTKQLISLVHDKSKWSLPLYQRYSYVREMKCQYPKKLRGKQLMDITNKDLGCEYIVVEKMMVEGIACLGTVVVILVAILLFVAVLIYCRRSRHRFVWNVNSAAKDPARFSDPAEVYTVVIPSDKQQIPTIKIPSIL